MSEKNVAIGIIGLGVMGRNLTLNIADQGFTVAGYDKDPEKGKFLEIEAEHRSVIACDSLKKMVSVLQKPRTVLLLIPAGRPVDSAIAELVPLLEENDLIIDGGNSYFSDTDLRQKTLSSKGIHFMGMGISGGEKGARHGPCMMPGGERELYERVRPILEKCAAWFEGTPCITYLGPGSAGHFVKMVHNGIEYGILQLIAETYDLAKRGLGLDDARLSELYQQWNDGDLESFLLENTSAIFRQVAPQTGRPLIDVILDEAKQKGTGSWTSQSAMDLQVPIPTIDAAVGARNLSMYKDTRAHASEIFKGLQQFDGNHHAFLQSLQNAFYAASIVTYSQGMWLLSVASHQYSYNFDLAAIAQIWRGGCIIRAKLLGLFHSAYDHGLQSINPLLDPCIAKEINLRAGDLRLVTAEACRMGIPVPSFSSSLSYFDGMRSEWLPANLIQALRDSFGAHTYERIDKKGVFHTNWTDGDSTFST
jgi:6-phosphogluconate dehydrogenase